jgi:hypothetical protein
VISGLCRRRGDIKTNQWKESEMAANQVSKQRNQSTGSRNPAGQQQRGQGARRQESGQAQSSSSYGAIGDMAEQASDYVSESAEQVQECIREHSAASIMISLVAGFGIGALIGRAIATPHHQESRSRRYRAMAEGFGTRLMDRIESVIPDAIAEHFSK